MNAALRRNKSSPHPLKKTTLPAFVNWIAATLLSAFFLGLYDLCTKHAVRANAVTPVLFFSTLTGALVWTALLLVQFFHPGILPPSLVTDALTVNQHLQLLLKSAIVAASWIGTYYALKSAALARRAGARDESAVHAGRRDFYFGRASDIF